jgi:AraC-like DNA-binding protein
MTLQEVAQQLGKSESTIYKNFRRTQETLLKKGIILTRWGPDEYEIEYEEADETYLEEKQRQNQIEYHRRKLQELEEQGE